MIADSTSLRSWAGVLSALLFTSACSIGSGSGDGDGLSLLADLIAPDAVTLVELGRDHFLLDDQVDVATLALAVTLIRQVEHPSQGILLLPKASGVGSGVGESP